MADILKKVASAVAVEAVFCDDADDIERAVYRALQAHVPSHIVALAGIPDPTAFVEAARGMREALEIGLLFAKAAIEEREFEVTSRGEDPEQDAFVLHYRDCAERIDTALTSFRAAMGEGQSDE